MDILGIGPLELMFILLIALIVLGPKDMVKAGKTIGRTLRTIVTSDTWRIATQASKEIRNLPNRLIREAGIEEIQKQLPDQRTLKEQLGLPELEQSMNQGLNMDLKDWTTPPPTIAPPQASQAGDDTHAIPDAPVQKDTSDIPGINPEATSSEADLEQEQTNSSQAEIRKGNDTE